MPRRKKPQNETEKEAQIRRELESVANVASRSEKTSWNRKMNNMVKLLTYLEPIQDQLLQLHAQEMDILDEINILRAVMVKECVHPYDHLLHEGDYIKCKFCEKKLGLSKNDKETSKT